MDLPLRLTVYILRLYVWLVLLLWRLVCLLLNGPLRRFHIVDPAFPLILCQRLALMGRFLAGTLPHGVRPTTLAQTGWVMWQILNKELLFAVNPDGWNLTGEDYGDGGSVV